MEGGGEANDGGGAITDGPEVDGSDDITINIRCSGGKKIVIQASLDSSVESFKSVIAKHCDIPGEQQRLIYNGRLLKDDHTLRSYDLQAEDTVHLVRSHLPSTIDFSEFPEFEQIQQPWIQNPRMSQEVLNQLITNPDAPRNMVMNCPRFREVIDRDPALSHAFNDPVMFRTMAESIVICELVARVGGGGGGGGNSGGGGTPRHPAGTDRSALPVGLGGLEITGLEELFGLPPDPIARNQIMQNPAISQLIQRFLSNPQNMNLILHPQFKEIMQTHVLTSQSQLPSPQIMQEMMALDQSPSYLLGEQQSTSWDVGQTSGDTVGPEEVYASKLAQLEEMGFPDTRQNVEAVIATKGNIPAAVDRLRGGQ